MDLPSGPAVVLTREPEDNLELALALRQRKIIVVEMPCLATNYLSQARLPAGPFDAITFSSRRGVRGFTRLDPAQQKIATGKTILLGAVGQATADELTAAGLRVDLVADPPEGKILAEMLIERLKPNARIMAVRGNLRAGKMDTLLRQAGHQLEAGIVYENLEPEIESWPPFQVAAIFVASPSAAKRLLEKNPWMKEKSFLAIGPTTVTALQELGVDSCELIGAQSDSWLESLTRAGQRPAKSEKPCEE
jgi:uroporphyrinogen-III synthase